MTCQKRLLFDLISDTRLGAEEFCFRARA